MLAIRLQRLGRKALPVYRVAVQESQRHPSSGRVVAYVGAYNPHTKEVKIDAEKVGYYLKNGAQPTPRVVRLLEAEKIELPSWVKKASDKTGKIRNADKLRKNQPKEEAPAEEATEAPAEEKTEE
jgi:small subunit ribosomal protein S16